MAAVIQQIFLAAALLVALTCVAEEQWKNVRGGARLRALFAQKEFGDGVHFAYRFKADGTFTGTEMAKTVSGTWQVVGDRFCWSWVRPPGPRECYEVQQDGKNLRLLVNGSEAWYGTLR